MSRGAFPFSVTEALAHADEANRDFDEHGFRASVRLCRGTGILDRPPPGCNDANVVTIGQGNARDPHPIPLALSGRVVTLRGGHTHLLCALELVDLGALDFLLCHNVEHP